MSSADSVGRHSLLADRVGRPDVEGTAEAARPEAAALELKSLFLAHHASIWRLLLRLGVDRAELDDAAQEVFWVASRRLSDIQPGSEHAFLYGVALRVASNSLRRQKALPAIAELGVLSGVAHLGPSPEQSLEDRRARELLDAVLDRLPHELRTVLVLFELEGLPVKAIAELEGIPVGTASSRLRRAREEFSAIAKRTRSILLGRGTVRP